MTPPASSATKARPARADPAAAARQAGSARPVIAASCEMSDAFKREIDKGTVPGATVLVARRGQIGWFEALGRQSPAAERADGARQHLPHLLDDQADRLGRHHACWSRTATSCSTIPSQKFIPEFADQKVGVENNGKLDLVPLKRPMTIQDLLRHTSGITYDHTGNGPVQQIYQQSRLRSRKISNAEHATLIAGMPLICQPGAEWNYSRSTDILGRIIEVVSGKSLGAFLTERILAPLQMAETAFHTGADNAGRLAEPFADRSLDRRQGGSCSTCWRSRRWNPAAAAWSRPRWTMRGSARCCSTAARSTAPGSSAARRWS